MQSAIFFTLWTHSMESKKMAPRVIHHPWLAFHLLTNKQQLVNFLFKLIRKSTLSVF